MSRRIFLAYVILTTCLVSGQSPRYVLKGQKVTLKKDITGQPSNILWTHNGNKVVEFNGREEYVYDPYKTRVTLDRSSAELHISELRLEDSGKYELEVFVNQKLEKSDYDVEIVDRVAKPTISCNINSNISGTLVCSAEPTQPVMTFEWHSQGSVHPGPHLQISLGDEHDDKVYSCTVRNPLTTETAAFTAKDCHTTKSSSLAPIAIAIAVVIPLLLLFIVGAGIFYYYKKQKGCFAHESEQGHGSSSQSGEDQTFLTPASLSSVPRPAERLGISYRSDVTYDHRLYIKMTMTYDSGLSDEPDGSSEVGPDVNSPADIPQGLVKRRSKILQPTISPVIEKHMAKQHQRPIPALQEKESKRASDNDQHQPSDDSSVHKDSDGPQLDESAEGEKQQDADSLSCSVSAAPVSALPAETRKEKMVNFPNLEKQEQWRISVQMMRLDQHQLTQQEESQKKKELDSDGLCCSDLKVKVEK